MSRGIPTRAHITATLPSSWEEKGLVYASLRLLEHLAGVPVIMEPLAFLSPLIVHCYKRDAQAVVEALMRVLPHEEGWSGPIDTRFYEARHWRKGRWQTPLP